MTSPTRLLAIVRKEVRQLRRDRLTFGMVIGLPIIQILLFGYAINTDVRNLRTAVVDASNSHLSRQFVAELAETQVVDIVATRAAPSQLEDDIRTGTVPSACTWPTISTGASRTRGARPCSCWSTAVIRRYSPWQGS